MSGDPKRYIPSRNIQYVFNLREADGDKVSIASVYVRAHANTRAQGLWYVKEAGELGVLEVIHQPLETKKDTDRTRAEDGDVLRVATRVANTVRQVQKEYEARSKTANGLFGRRAKPSVFIHGYQGAHLATVVALVAWYLIEDDNAFNPLKALSERYDKAIAESFPEHWFHRDQVTRICNTKRKSVYAAMKRGGIQVTRTSRRAMFFKKDEK